MCPQACILTSCSFIYKYSAVPFVSDSCVKCKRNFDLLMSGWCLKVKFTWCLVTVMYERTTVHHNTLCVDNLIEHYNSINVMLFMKLYNCAMIVQYLVQYTTIFEQ